MLILLILKTTRVSIAFKCLVLTLCLSIDSCDILMLSGHCLLIILFILFQTQPAAPQPSSSGLADLLMVDTGVSQPANTGTVYTTFIAYLFMNMFTPVIYFEDTGEVVNIGLMLASGLATARGEGVDI